MRLWSEQVAVVTGAGSGIGRAAALAFAGGGARVVSSDISEHNGEQTARLIREQGGEAIFVKADVSHASNVEQLVDATVKTYGRLDFAFNNAGMDGAMASTAECTEANWDRVVDLNLKGVWLCMKYELRQMLTQRHGVIVNCASVAGLVGMQQLPAYVASKHGVVGLTRAASLEYARSGIRVNAVCPGAIRTPLVDRVIRERPEMEAQLTAAEPIGRLGTPEEVAAAVMWLCADAASFVTGQALAVDGGWVAQ